MERLLGLVEEANCISLCVLEKAFSAVYMEGMEYAGLGANVSGQMHLGFFPVALFVNQG
jgi:hypothetical protein